MAKSKNRRKNGKVIKTSDANVKRMRRMASYDLKNLCICSAVDVVELKGDNRQRLEPKSVVFDRKLRDVVHPTRLQAVALNTQPWKWNIYSAIVCRKQNGEVYLWREENIMTVTEVNIRDMNDYISDTLCDHWEECNPLHRLTMVWVAAPYDMGDVPLEAILAPLHYFQLLGRMLTKYEQETEDHVTIAFRAKCLKDFSVWWIDQQRYREELKLLRTTTFWFEPTGEKMAKGQLVAYRGRIAGLDIFKGTDPFKPLASVKGFEKWGKQSVVSDGWRYSELMTALQDVPPCLNAVVEVRFVDGRKLNVKFFHGKEREEWK